MREKFTIYDPAETLTSPEALAYFLTDAFESGDANYIAQALGVAARSEGMTEIARRTGLAREALYRSLTENGNPTLNSVMLVMNALKLQLVARPKAAEQDALKQA